MPLSPGTRLGHYEVVEAIGAGGMGEVYRARDTKLGRDVAIKVLPEEFSQDRERLDRSQREARLLAQLNHSNIATLYGLEESGGQQFLIMELVEGETLAERIAKGPIPVDEGIPLFIQIADGLEAAHEKGIIHRDLKPANIKIGTDGKPKILDFGLAKALMGADERVLADASQSPTLTKGTALGAIMGTAAYMSPEQARGKIVDKRTDIWAFGVCLFEAMTGRHPFDGETLNDIIAAVLQREPNWDALPPSTPWRVRELLERSLRKNGQDRLRDIGDVRIRLEDALTGPQPEVPSGRQTPPVAPWLVATLGVIAAVLLTWFLRPSPNSPERPLANVRLGLQPAVELRQFWSIEYPLFRAAIALSPDGRYIAFTGGSGGGSGERSELFLRSLEETEAVAIPGTEGALGPFFSPDGRWIGFWADEELRKVRVEGGPPQTLCDVAIPPNGATWGQDGTILFGASEQGILRVSAGGGEPEPVTKVREGEESHGLPHFLPGGDAILYTAGSTQMMRHRAERARVIVESLKTGERKVLVENAADGRYVPTGHLVFIRLGTLMAASFDLDRLELRDAPLAIRDGVYQDVNFTFHHASRGGGQFAFSATGWLAYLPGGVPSLPETHLVWVNRDGTSERLESPAGNFWYPRISPDGSRVAVIKDVAEILVSDLAGRTWTRITSPENESRILTWSPEGQITFRSDRDGPGFIFQTRVDQGATVEQLTTVGTFFPASWTADGQVLALVRQATDSTPDIWMLPRGGRPEPFIESPASEWWPEFSPDGRWLAYGSDETGRFEVYVVPYPGPGPRIQISTDGGAAPAWAGNGRELFFTRRGASRNPDGIQELFVVDIEHGPELSSGRPRLLFQRPIRSSVPARSYDVSADGQRFLIIESLDSDLPKVTEIRLVVNWFEELNRLVPTDS